MRRTALAAALLALPAGAAAHGFGRLYNLPVPFWLYAWATAAVLLLTFLLTAHLASAAPAAPAAPALRRLPWLERLWRRLRPALRLAGLCLLLLTLATAAFGNRDPYRNFSMTFFWVVFVLGYTYLTALAGSSWRALNPWRTLATLIGRRWRGYLRGRLAGPWRWGEAPALLLYLGFIWVELFGLGRPASLAQLLAGYTVVNLAGVGLLGSRAWFRHGEFFTLFFRLTGLMGVLHRGPDGRLALRRPFAGLLQSRPQQLSTVLFLLAMLSTTAFDGLKATQWWVFLFWLDPSGLVTALAGDRPLRLYGLLRPWYIAWETLWLLVSPLLYFGAYAASLALARWLAGSARPLHELMLDFAFSLLPIALVYHFTHYATLLLSQGLKIVSLLSDPFGRGWNLLGTAGLLRAPVLPDMGLVWHSQVGLILSGHLVSVVLAHRVALRVFPGRRAALLSQLPLLLLMVGLTVAGLWILAQPLTDEKAM